MSGDDRIPIGDAAAACRLLAGRAAGAPVLVPTGTGTALARGLPLPEPHVYLDVSGMDAVLDVAPGDMTIRVEAGLPLARLREVLVAGGQWLPPAGLPGAEETEPAGTVGGLIAADRRPPPAGGLGSIRDYLIGVRFADGQGRDVRAGGNVVKNVAGYDLMKLLIGSLGTFGVVLEATFKVLPLPARVGGVRLRAPASGLCLRAQSETVARWLPAALWREGAPDEPEDLVAVFAGPEARVAAQTAGTAADWGAGAEILDPDTARRRLRSPAAWRADPGRDLVWGGGLPADLARAPLPAFVPGGEVVVDLLAGHVWARVPADAARTGKGNGRAGEGRQGDGLNRDRDPGGGDDAWGHRPEDEARVWSGLKQALDPRGVLVHGRLPGGV